MRFILANNKKATISWERLVRSNT